MKRLDLIRQIEQSGCFFVRHGGRHDCAPTPPRNQSRGLPNRLALAYCAAMSGKDLPVPGENLDRLISR